MQITSLSHHPQAIPLVARWLFEQWGYLTPDESLEALITFLQTELHDDKIPLTLVAFSENDVVGTVSLLEYDMETRYDLSPWLANLYVVPEQRRQGVGTALIRAVLGKAKTLAIPELYLFTHDQECFYQHLGWQRVEKTYYRGQEVVIMKR